MFARSVIRRGFGGMAVTLWCVALGCVGSSPVQGSSSGGGAAAQPDASVSSSGSDGGAPGDGSPAGGVTSTSGVDAGTGVTDGGATGATGDGAKTDGGSTEVTLTVQRSGSGSGVVSGSGLDCGATCSMSIAQGLAVELTAKPDATSTFAGWTGCDATTGTTCTVTMSAPRSVTAEFGVACNVPSPPTVAAAGVLSIYGPSGFPYYTVEWEPVAGATSYNVYRGTQPDGLRASGTRFENASSPYVEVAYPLASAYWYVATAVNACGEGEASAPVGGPAPDGIAPPASVAVACTPHVGPSWTFDLTWPAAQSATSYDVSFVSGSVTQRLMERIGSTASRSISVTVNACSHLNFIPGGHTAYAAFGVASSTCAPGVSCPVASPAREAGWLDFCVEAPVVTGWEKTTRTLRWAPAAGATRYFVQACTSESVCGASSLVIEATSCTATECSAVLPTPWAGTAPFVAVDSNSCASFEALNPRSPPFAVQW